MFTLEFLEVRIFGETGMMMIASLLSNYEWRIYRCELFNE
jgi:hypothetical protein